MNILFLTLGTSEVQINPNPGEDFTVFDFKLKKAPLPDINLKQNRGYDNYLLKSPRVDGEHILKFYDQYSPVIRLPLILPLIFLLKSENISLDEIWLVFTDQKDAAEPHKLNDTLYFKEIVKRKIKNEFPDVQFHEYGIEEKVRDIDFQYLQFGKEILTLAANQQEIEKVYLLPQGGIDQINQALTLQLIQYFKDKVILYQNAELSKPEKLKFTQLFLNDLTKQNVIKHIKDFDFDKAADLILDNEHLRTIAQYAAMRLNLLHENINDHPLENDFKINWETLDASSRKKRKFQDMVYSFKILLKQRNYNEALAKLFSVTENLFKIPLSEYSGEQITAYYDRSCELPGSKNEKWEKFIEEKLGNGYINELTKKGKHINNPNFLAESFLYRLLIRDFKITIPVSVDEIKQLTSSINDLRGLRNDIVHNLGSASLEDIQNILSKNNTNIETFLQTLDKITATKDLGIYQRIQEEILAVYGERA